MDFAGILSLRFSNVRMQRPGLNLRNGLRQFRFTLLFCLLVVQSAQNDFNFGHFLFQLLNCMVPKLYGGCQNVHDQWVDTFLPQVDPLNLGLYMIVY